jgi:hypothetical protein
MAVAVVLQLIYRLLHLRVVLSSLGSLWKPLPLVESTDFAGVLMLLQSVSWVQILPLTLARCYSLESRR